MARFEDFSEIEQEILLSGLYTVDRSASDVGRPLLKEEVYVRIQSLKLEVVRVLHGEPAESADEG